MTRRIQERDRLTVDLDAVCTDVLRDAARLACGNVRLTDAVQQGGLAVVNVTHDNDNRASRLQIFFLVLALVEQLLLNADKDFLLYLRAHLLSNQRRSVKVDGL